MIRSRTRYQSDRTRLTDDHREKKRRPHTRTGMMYNMYGDDFLIDKIQPEEIGEELVNVGQPVADEEWQTINDSENSLQDDYSVPEREVDLKQSEIEKGKVQT